MFRTVSDAAAAPPPTASQPRPASPGPLEGLRRFARTPKGLLILFFVPLFVVGAGSSRGIGWGTAVAHVGTAILAACVADALLFKIARGAWRWPSGALLSGAILGFVLGPETPAATTAAVAAVAIASKYVLRLGRGHVFNPAGFALLLSIPLFATGQSWWGALADVPAPWLLVLLTAGVVVTDRIAKFPLVLTFTGVTYTIYSAFALIGGTTDPHLAELFRPPFVQAGLFFACFMLTDPPTAPGPVGDQLWIGTLVAVVSAGAQLLGAGQSYLMLGLAAGNIALAAHLHLRRRRVSATRPLPALQLVQRHRV